MGRAPRSQTVIAPGPSPLQQVHLIRPVSQLPPTSGLVRDPAFWKRFSRAMHEADIPLDEEKGERTVSTSSSRNGSKSSGSSLEKKKKENDWLAQQRREKRQCRLTCLIITLIVMLVIIGAAVVGWYFTHIKKI